MEKGPVGGECRGDDLGEVGVQESNPIKLCMYYWPPPGPVHIPDPKQCDKSLGN